VAAVGASLKFAAIGVYRCGKKKNGRSKSK